MSEDKSAHERVRFVQTIAGKGTVRLLPHSWKDAQEFAYTNAEALVRGTKPSAHELAFVRKALQNLLGKLNMSNEEYVHRFKARLSFSSRDFLQAAAHVFHEGDHEPVVDSRGRKWTLHAVSRGYSTHQLIVLFDGPV